MATTSIWRVKGYLSKVLLYAENPDKTTDPHPVEVPKGVNLNALEDVISYAKREDATEQRRFVSGVNCTPENAREVMMRTKQQFEKLGGTIAYHGYQSFKEGEVTPEIAHQIGKKLAEELWGDQYEVLVTTHVDKESHIHNHFVLNTVSFVDGIKYHRTKEDYQAMRDASDRLCREYGLSVVKHPEGRGKNYGEWRAEQNGKPTYRDRIKRDIDTAISMSLTDNEFFRNLKDMGYEIKWEGKHKELQHPSLKPKGAKKYFRFDRLGEEYSLDEIYNRILENIRRKDPFPEETQEEVRKYRHEHPPKVDLGGLTKLYYYYCYELHIIVRYPTSVSRVSHFMREDLMKLDHLDEQSRFLATNKIQTMDDIAAYRESTGSEIERLKAERKDLRNELKRVLRSGNEDAALAVKMKIADTSAKLKKLQDSLVICDSVEERSTQMQAELGDIRKQTGEKEVDNDEQLFGRSSGTSREDEPKRR
ncbi:MAG: relaxase/mobilization nuclease domain-containing protein [Clostridiales bacterium]|nr:relaxase/mobilization nuclease domain-containing protein [Clostridiales bacterium]